MIAFNNRKPELAVDTAGIYSVQDVQDFFLDERVEELKGLKWLLCGKIYIPFGLNLCKEYFHEGYHPTSQWLYQPLFLCQIFSLNYLLF